MNKTPTTLMRQFALLLLGGAVLLGLSACGRPGNPKPPGPAEKITFPQIYPPE